MDLSKSSNSSRREKTRSPRIIKLQEKIEERLDRVNRNTMSMFDISQETK